MAGGEAPAKKSDLGVRVLSAIVMVAIAGSALWLGGWVWTVFVAAVALGVLWEWAQLSGMIARSLVQRVFWLCAGLVYIGLAAVVLWFLRNAPALQHNGIEMVLMAIAPVIATDIGAYFAGRAIGGPKIAPKISPSKTWAGLFGGMLAAALVMIVLTQVPERGTVALVYFPIYAVIGGVLAIVAQAGDFFESWMKRRAGVKDSGKLIPGHGGLFDRVDGLLAVCFVIGVLSLHSLFIAE